MAKLILALLAVLFSGCALSPSERASIAGAVIITSIAISLADDGHQDVVMERKVCDIMGSVVICEFR
jgi:hypothetical protein